MPLPRGIIVDHRLLRQKAAKYKKITCKSKITYKNTVTHTKAQWNSKAQ